MTSQSPRIYTYKITFEEVPYYYYGVHKEKKCGEEYWGTPITNKWCWEFYTPKKQILEYFDCWEEAQRVEGRIIREFYNKDKWCLNAHVQGIFSLQSKSKAGKIGGKIGGIFFVCVSFSQSKQLNTQKWMCLETGMVSTIGPLTRYQRVRGIDTSKKVKINN